MELSFDIWNQIFESCKSFVEKRKLYYALPDSFRGQYPKSFIYPDGDKYLLKYLSIDDEKEVIFSRIHLFIAMAFGTNQSKRNRR